MPYMKPLSADQKQRLRETMNRFVAKIIARQAMKLEVQRYSGVSRFFSATEDSGA